MGHENQGISLGDIGAFLDGPIMQWLIGASSIPEAQNNQNQFNADQSNQRSDLLNIATQIPGQTLGAYDQGAMESLLARLDLRDEQHQSSADLNQFSDNRTQGIMEMLTGRERDISQAYTDRYNTASREFEGYGEQQKVDVDERFNRDLEADTSFRIERGINSTTAASSNRSLNTRQRSAEQRRLSEGLQLLRRQILDPLSGEGLSARMGMTGDMANAQISLTGDGYNSRQRGIDVDRQLGNSVADLWHMIGANRANITQAGGQGIMQAIGGYDYIPPSNPYPGQFGAASVDAPSAPDQGNDWLGPAISTGGAIAAASILAAGGICIDGDSMIPTLEGDKTLRDIQVGDMAINADGKPKAVVAKHFGAYEGGYEDYAELVLDSGVITASLEHVVEGHTVSHWVERGDVEWRPMSPEFAGDILLEDGSDYVANCVRISSMIWFNDIKILDILEPEHQTVKA